MRRVLDRAIEFYERSPDGQYDAWVARVLKTLRRLEECGGDEAIAACMGELSGILEE